MYLEDFIEKKNNTDSDEEPFSTTTQNDIAKNGSFFIIAVLGFFIKLKRKQIDIRKIQKDKEWIEEIQRDRITGSFINVDFKGMFSNNIQEIFTTIIQELADVYERKAASKTTISVSNFLKTDPTFSNIMLVHMKNQLLDKPSVKENFYKLLEIFK
jgi:hypothetical protein